MNRLKILACFEALILVMASVSLSYVLGIGFGVVSATEISQDDQTQIEEAVRESGNEPSNLRNMDLGVVSDILNRFVPQASQIGAGEFLAGLNGQSGGLKVCAKTKNNAVCQQMTGKQCESECDGECFDGGFADLPSGHDCSFGTCIDSEQGTCTPRATKKNCDEFGGTWDKREEQSIPECVKGCCSLVDSPIFTTENGCEKIAESNGVEMGVGAFFDGSITDEPSCILSFNEGKKGACVFEEEGEIEKGCKFVIREECEALTEREDNFYEGILCSNEELGTRCTRQNSTSCVEGLDGLYWFDSCGNRENIYDSDKEKSWNDGNVLELDESCDIGNSENPLENQATCGNCDRFSGSICGEKTDEQKLEDETQMFVCRDMNCYEDGKMVRRHGESWCAYQSSVGLPGPDVPGLDSLRNSLNIPALSWVGFGARSTDTPGSVHFRKTCNSGEIEISACDNFRNQICVEDQTPINESDNFFSQASCRLNRWQECLAYNPGGVEARLIGFAGPKAGDLIRAKLELTCGLDPDCFVKSVDLTRGGDDTFKFSYCAPRYAPGFDMNDNPEAASELCGQASQECTAVYVNMLGAGWTCKANCECEKQTFVQQMNELCTSMGDCGLKVNYLGSQPGGKGYRVGTKDKPGVWDLLGGTPFADLFEGGGFGIGVSSLANFGDANYVYGEYIPSTPPEILTKVRESWIVETFSSFDLDSILSGIGGKNNVPDVEDSSATDSAMNLGLISGATGGAALAGAYAFSVPATATITVNGLTTSAAATLPNPALGSFGSAALGAGLGLAVTSFLIDILGIGPGLPTAVTYGLVGAGGVAGGIMTYSAWQGGSLGAALSNPLGVIIAVAVLVIIIIFKIMGIGDVEEKKVSFECLPWQAPQKGECEMCGQNDKLSDGSEGFPCNKYSCQSIAQNCKYIKESEGPGGGLCVTADEDDVTAPRIIDVWEDVLTEGYVYSEKPYDQGFFIRKENGGCMNQFEQLTFGFNLDEYGWCRISGERKENFEEMLPLGGISRNQSYTLSGYNFETLGISELDVEEENDVSLYVVCEDAVGVKNMDRPYIVNLCVTPDDLTAPVVNNVFPSRDKIASFGSTEEELFIYISEQAECRWDYEEKEYSDMGNVFQCNNDLEDRDYRGFECFDDIVLRDDETKICVKCRDHPDWAGTDEEGDRNTNAECEYYNIKRSESPLVIKSLYPNNITITTGREIPDLEISVETEGGIDGNADCFFKLDNSIENKMFETGGRIHKQKLGSGESSLGEKKYSLNVRCFDGANTATNSTTFDIKRDLIKPNVARVYSDSGSLFVVSDEPSQCVYLNSPIENRQSACYYSFDEAEDKGNIISLVDSGFVHSIGYDGEKTYYIKCKDLHGNENVNECDMIVKRGDI